MARTPLHLASFRLSAITLIVAVAVGLLALVNWRYNEVRHENGAMFDRQATARATAIAAQLGDTIAATLQQANVSHDLARLVTEAHLAGDSRAVELLRPYLDPDTGFGGPDVAQVSGLAADGAQLWTNLSREPVRQNFADRDYFRQLRAVPSLEMAFGAPVLGRTSGAWTVQAVRAMRDANGALRAITDVSLRANMLARLSRDIALEPEDEIMLLRDDGAVLMRRDLSHLGDNAVFGNPMGGLGDGVPRYAAMRAIPGAALQVYVGLSRPAQETIRAALDDALWHWSMLLDAGIVSFALFGGFAFLTLHRSGLQAARANDLARSEAWFRAVIDDMADGVLVFDNLSDGDLRIAFASRQAGIIFGVPAAELAGRSFESLIAPEDRDWVSARKRAALSAEQLPEAEYRAQRADGSVVWVASSTVMSSNPIEPSRVRAITSLRDVTEHRARDHALAAARARADRILDVAPGVFFQLTKEPGQAAHISYVSPSVEAMFGVTATEAATPGFLTNLAGIDLAAVRMAALAKAGPNGVAMTEYPIMLHGQRLWLREAVRRMEATEDAFEVVGFLIDVTAEHAAEAAMQRLNWALASYSRSLSTLVRSGSLHEVMMRVCESIVEEPAYNLACVGLPETTAGLPIRFVASAGRAAGYMEGLNVSWAADRPEGQGPTGTAIREGVPQIMRDAETDPKYATWRDRGRQFGVRSSITLPCKAGDTVVGALLVYAAEAEAFGQDELELFQRLSDEIGFAIRLEQDRARLQAAEAARRIAEENLRAAAQLGPGLLYRARIHPAEVEILHVFGDASRVTQDIGGSTADPATLATILAVPEQIEAIRALRHNATRSEDYAVTTEDGGARWVRNTVRVTDRHHNLRDDAAVDVVGYISEITREKHEQLHRQQVTTLLTLGEMATGLAHELNQPLASISFTAQNAAFLLDRTPANIEGVRGRVAKIIGEVQRASRLIDHMRVFARNEHEELRPITWRAVLDDALEILRSKLRCCEIVDLVPADLPAVAGVAIPMEQVLINLLSNAVDAYANAAPGVPRTITVRGGCEDGAVTLRVEDRAGGIPAAALPRVFEPFFTTKPPGRGTGLGLALVFGTVVEMGGTITAANEDGGAVFEIRLPAVQASPDNSASAMPLSPPMA